MIGYCIATYRCYDDKADFAKKAQSIAVGLTVGSWTELPEAKKAAMEKHLGKVISVDVHEPVNLVAGERYADIRIAYPDVNFSRDIPALLVTIFGKLSMDGKVKLIDIEVSPEFESAFPGPQFGMQGVRDLVGVHNRPLLMSIFKSVIGHDLTGLEEQFYRQALGGVDLVKDDEILFENPLTPLEKRVETCMRAARKAKETTGQELLYAVNLTGPTSQLNANARRAIAAGANALLFNVLAYGFDALHELSADPTIHVPIAAHPAMAGAFYPSPYYGISANVLLGKLMRLAGADLVLFPSPYGSVVMPKEENMAVRDALLDPTISLRTSFPVPSAGIHPGLVPLILRDFGSDVIVNAGGGVHGHPLGTEAGGQAFRQAISAALAGQPLREAAVQAGNEALKAAIDAWGVREA
ncbi:2,3-diketo-5-methylthiopentyl-1-phosphate enolase [Paenibacillus cellulosilyticus]|uniref:2,3-diketo-5-methylthiopentyl-1-phosphate enolase n=1 Tax=Paenibacillus cellulosilyticus TaxID=375489 RepID=A0A2V2YZR0_9BACL|nr:2,3-diketo-5-methylthiopentyl-1-phosphate enolase [Paenibacillus cellulosilyticus]PWW05498.1 2,3-diketo-5-methylthiopentyl-1-phosphate enolase [Paenibacillus cellulosilyticus]QKS45464.1 2,3-diketo-5-methylthiopentyl-1-phosphate enolase [Paenibacillus cellulosilyticus]